MGEESDRAKRGSGARGTQPSINKDRRCLDAEMTPPGDSRYHRKHAE
jgi:hypothetical protein